MGNNYNRVYIWSCKYSENRYCERCANKKWCASKHTGLLNSCLGKLCLHPYLVVPLISARVTLISTRVSAHCLAILLTLPFLRYKIFKFDLENLRWRWTDNAAQLHVWTIPYNFEWYKSIQRFQRYGFHKVWPKCCLIWKVLGHGQAHMGQIGKLVWQCTTTNLDKPIKLEMG